ncbi:MAG: DUF533 domain-containing protein [Alphaproteobacteria bacterium]
MAESQAVLNNLVAKDVGSHDGKPKFGRRRGKKEPLAEGSMMAQALDGGAAAGSEANARLLLRAMIAAACADGTLDDDERARIMDGAPDTEFLAAEIENPFDIPALVKAVDSPAVAADVYAASLMAIELDTVEEADYLRWLAEGLGLDEEAVAALHDRCGAPPLAMVGVPVV